MREGLIKEMRTVWSIKQEVVLTETTEITFLGLQMKKYSGCVIVLQEKFIEAVLGKQGLSNSSSLTMVTVD
eukprot:6701459-Prorocentrum_lima.AAC.1